MSGRCVRELLHQRKWLLALAGEATGSLSYIKGVIGWQHQRNEELALTGRLAGSVSFLQLWDSEIGNMKEMISYRSLGEQKALCRSGNGKITKRGIVIICGEGTRICVRYETLGPATSKERLDNIDSVS